MKQPGRIEQDRRGAALVEMALVFPIFMALVLGIVEFGHAMMVSQLVTNASREGARLGTVDGNTNKDIENRVESFLTNAMNVNADDITVKIGVTPSPDSDCTSDHADDAEQFDLVTVHVSVPFSEVSLFIGKYLEGKKLYGESSMRHE